MAGRTVNSGSDGACAPTVAGPTAWWSEPGWSNRVRGGGADGNHWADFRL